MNYVIDNRLRDRGLKICVLEAWGLRIRHHHSGLELTKKFMGDHIRHWKTGTEEFSTIWQDYQETYEAIDPAYEAFVPASKYSIAHLRRRQKFNTVNTLVDICNVVSASSLLSVVAHSQDGIEGTFRIGITTGNETFIPMGSNTPVYVSPGEYAHMDDHDILCRLDVRQAQKTMVSLDTHRAIIVIHGNRVTPRTYVLNAAQQIIDYIYEFCGGDCRFINHRNLISPM